MANYNINNIPKEKFQIAKREGVIHDKKFDTKPIGYFKDALMRFGKNKSSIFGFAVIMLLVIYAIIGPYCFPKNYRAAYELDKDLQNYQYLLPKATIFEGTGFWDGTTEKEISSNTYYMYTAMEQEMGRNIIDVLETKTVTDSTGSKTLYKVRLDSYTSIKVMTKTFSKEQYEAIQAYQNETGRQIILPYVDYYNSKSEFPLEKLSGVKFNNSSVYFECDINGTPVLDENGNIIPAYRNYSVRNYTDDYQSLRIMGDPGIEDPTSIYRYSYAFKTGSTDAPSYSVRINPYEYFVYKFGFEPSFLFGTNNLGYDIFSRLASGARFSLLFALLVSAINMFIGAIYGAVEGYYGGTTDLVMERITDILGGIPSMVVTILFNLHLTSKVGAVPALLYAFIFTGWIGMSSRTRMQFYRFKNQEYVLAARTLGASDRRVMFKHIFPNSLGTLITGSVLSIPGVIFSETSLTYLGIINLDSPTRASVGAMLSGGQALMTTYPHLVFFPALFIGLLMICFNMFGNGLRDAFNPSLRGAEG